MAPSIAPFVSAAIRSIRVESELTGPEMQRRLGLRSRAGFSTTEGRWSDTTWGRVFVLQPTRLSLDRFLRISEALNVMPEALLQEARAIRDEHHHTINEGCAALGLDRETFIAKVRAGERL